MKLSYHSDRARQATTLSSPSRWAILLYATVCYLGFHAVFLWMVMFLNDIPILPSVNSGTARHWAAAIVINLGLVLLFGLQHSVMARHSFKKAWTRIVPEPAERATYVLATVACLALAFAFWSPMTTTLWRVEQPIAFYGILAVQAVGWTTLVWATFALSHFHLFGLTQAWNAFRGRPVPHLEFRTPAIYRVVRHPIQLGILIGIWAAPVMTVGHLVFAAAMTTYVFVGLFFEERDLVRQFGERYLAYRKSVPKVLPRLWTSPSPIQQGGAPVKASTPSVASGPAAD
jgi:protein-S-isoprenylcysteine O-methyltransferase Ste14